MQYLSVLTRYTNYGAAKDSRGTKLTANSLALLTRGIIPLDVFLPVKTHISLFFDIGYGYLRYKFDTPSDYAVASQENSKGVIAYDLGAGYNINSNLQVSLQYGLNGTSNVNNQSFVASMLSGNLSYYF
jgi:opacity protein-like surface antigen